MDTVDPGGRGMQGPQGRLRCILANIQVQGPGLGPSDTTQYLDTTTPPPDTLATESELSLPHL